MQSYVYYVRSMLGPEGNGIAGGMRFTMDNFYGIVGIIGALLGAWGVALSLSARRQTRMLKSVSWSELQSASKYFWKKLKAQEFKPDFIVTPGQKGGIIAQLVMDFYDEEIPIITGYMLTKGTVAAAVSPSYCISTTKWDVYLPPMIRDYMDKAQCKLLFIDDFIMSGDFHMKFKEELLNLGYKEENICSCVVAATKVAIDGDKGPSIYWKLVDDSEFYFPWGKAK